MMPTGFRSYMRVDYSTPNQVVTLDPSGAFIFVEVTAPSGGGNVDFYPNVDLPFQPGGGITVAAGTTRQIPMTVYNFKATGNCTVIAYRM